MNTASELKHKIIYENFKKLFENSEDKNKSLIDKLI
jgi:hypothetical protein